jgi:invasion protein IalB
MQSSLVLQPQLVFSPWTKICQNEAQENAQKACSIGKNGRTDSGTSFVAVVLIDSGTKDEKIMRVTLPLGMRLADGTWVAVDQGQPTNAPYIICINLGCIADCPASKELIETLKEGKQLIIRSVNSEGQIVSFALPLLDFDEAYNGPPTNGKELEHNDA